jgi:hypothetical protein
VIPILRVYAHFLTLSLQLKHALLSLKFIKGSHTREAIIEIIIALINEFEIDIKLGVFVTDNAKNCRKAYKLLVK